MDVWSTITAERRRLADDLEQLGPDQWSAPTVCSEWDVKGVAAHLVLPFEVSKPRFMITVIKNRRDVAKTIDELSAKVNAKLTTEQIVDSLRANAASKWKPPGAGPELPLTEIVVHGHDIRRAVGIACETAPEIVAAILQAAQEPTVRSDYASRITAQSVTG